MPFVPSFSLIILAAVLIGDCIVFSRISTQSFRSTIFSSCLILLALMGTNVLSTVILGSYTGSMTAAIILTASIMSPHLLKTGKNKFEKKKDPPAEVGLWPKS